MEIPTDYLPLQSGLAERQLRRIEQDQTGAEAATKGAVETAGAVFSFGTSGAVQGHIEAYEDLASGRISIEEYDNRVSQLAGVQTGVAIVGSATSRATGRTWTGRARPSTPEATVVKEGTSRNQNVLETVKPEASSGPITDPNRLLPVTTLDDVIAANYQRYYNEAATSVIARFNSGRIRISEGQNWRQVLGQRIDAEARGRMLNFLEREGIAEGPAADVLVNRWLRDPSGSGRYRIPDIMLRQTGRILEGTIGDKSMTDPQITDFRTYSGGFKVEIIRPQTPALKVRK
jgi:hypothetical protein